MPSRIRLRPRGTPPTPEADSETLFLDAADGALKSIDSTGTVTAVGGTGGGALPPWWTVNSTSGEESVALAGVASIEAAPTDGEVPALRVQGHPAQGGIPVVQIVGGPDEGRLLSVRRSMDSDAELAVLADEITMTAAVTIQPCYADESALSVTPWPGQTAPLFRAWNGGNPPDYGGFDALGYFFTAKHTAPADASLQAGQLALWFDQTDGAAKLKIKAKSANGTVVSGEIPLA